MLLVIFAVDNNIISIIGHPSQSRCGLADDMLVFLGCRVDSKTKTFITEYAIMGGESCNITRVLLQFNLVKSPSEVELGENVLPFRSSRISSTVGMGNFSRLMAVLALRVSTQSWMSPDAFGATTVGLTQVVGPSTLSNISFSRSSFTFSVTLPLREKGTRRTFWATGITEGSTVLPRSNLTKT